MKDPKEHDTQQEEGDLVRSIAEEVYGIPKEEWKERHVDPFKHGDDVVVYEWHAKEEDEE